MTDISPTAQPSPESFRATFFRKAKKLPWMNTAVVVSSTALFTIGLLSHLGVLHTGFSIPHVGTISAKTVAYLLYAGTGTILLFRVGKLGYDFYRTFRNETPIVVPEEGKKKVHPPSEIGMEEVDEEEYLTLKQSVLYAYLVTKNTDDWGYLKGRSKETVTFSEEVTSKQLPNGELIAILPKGTSKNLKTLQTDLSKTTDKNEITKTLRDFATQNGAKLIYQLNNEVYAVGPKEGSQIYFTTDFILDGVNEIRFVRQKDLKNTQYVLIGSDATLKAIAENQEQIQHELGSKEEDWDINIMMDTIQNVLEEKGVPEIAFALAKVNL